MEHSALSWNHSALPSKALDAVHGHERGPEQHPQLELGGQDTVAADAGRGHQVTEHAQQAAVLVSKRSLSSTNGLWAPASAAGTAGSSCWHLAVQPDQLPPTPAALPRLPQGTGRRPWQLQVHSPWQSPVLPPLTRGPCRCQNPETHFFPSTALPSCPITSHEGRCPPAWAA